MMAAGLIYLAGPLFSFAEREFNQRVADYLEGLGHKVFLPQRDGLTEDGLLQEGNSPEDVGRTIFAFDMDKLEEADVVVFVMDGRVPDEGACVEVGFAYARGKPCLGLRTDTRSFEDGIAVNPMLTGCLQRRVARNCSELGEYLKEVRGEAHG